MSWLTDMLTLKRLRNSREVVSSAVRMIEGSGSRGTVSRPFSQEAALAQYRSWVFVCANINASGFSSVPLRLYVPARSGARKLFGTKKVPRARMKWLKGELAHQPSMGVMTKAQDFGDFEEVERGHPLMALLERPNPFIDGYSFRNLSALWSELVGNSYHAIIRGNVGVPSELWPMPPNWVDIKPSTTNFIDGYWFGSEERNKKFYAPEDVIHVKRPNPRNQWYGMGKVEGGWWAISQNASKHEMDQALYDNHARPDYLLVAKGNAPKVTLDRFEEEIKKKMGGKHNAGKFLALTGEVDLKPLAWPPKDLGTEDRIIEEVCAAFSVPVSMALANDPNLASAKVGYAMWRELSTLPLCRLHEARWNAELVPLFDLGEEAFLAFDNPIPADEAFALAEKTASVGKWRTVNEVRAEEGYEPVDGGDDLYAPPGTPLDMARENAEIAQEVAKNPPNMGEDDGGDGKVPTEDGPKEAAGKSAGSRRIPYGDAGSAARGRTGTAGGDVHQVPGDGNGSGWVAKGCGGTCSCGARRDDGAVSGGDGDSDGDRRAALAVKAVAPGDDSYNQAQVNRLARLLHLSNEQVAAIIESRGVGVTVDAITAALTDPKFVEEFNDIIRPMMRAAVTDGARAGADAIGVQFDAELSPQVTEALRRRVNQLRGSITETTVARATRLVRDGMESGRTVQEIASTIRGDLGVDAARAESIARTESARAYTAGQEAAWQESGVVTGKRWLLAPDPCEFCEAAADQWASKPQTLGVPFYKRGHELAGKDGGKLTLDYSDVDGPPLHPQCRCAMTAVLESEGQ